MDEYLFYWLGTLNGIGLKKSALLMEKFKTVKNIFYADGDALEKVKGLKSKEIETILSVKYRERSRREWKRLEENKIGYFSYYGEGYPERLKTLYQPPKQLYVKGELPDPTQISIGIVGARNCTCYGRDMAHMFGYRLAKAGISVISGMAKGIDGWAHQGALEGGGKTYAVLGCGVEVCYPSVHRRLYDSIAKYGGIISEFEPYITAKPNFFPMRNRIISGLSDGILVVEAREKSGSLITADAALEQGKDVFVVPGRIGDELSVGCNRLIRQGAIPVTSPQDILERYHKEIIIEETLSTKENNILDLLGVKPIHTDQILAQCDMSETAVFRALLNLKKQKRIKEVARGFFIRV